MSVFASIYLDDRVQPGNFPLLAEDVEFPHAPTEQSRIRVNGEPYRVIAAIWDVVSYKPARLIVYVQPQQALHSKANPAPYPGTT